MARAPLRYTAAILLTVKEMYRSGILTGGVDTIYSRLTISGLDRLWVRRTDGQLNAATLRKLRVKRAIKRIINAQKLFETADGQWQFQADLFTDEFTNSKDLDHDKLVKQLVKLSQFLIDLTTPPKTTRQIVLDEIVAWLTTHYPGEYTITWQKLSEGFRFRATEIAARSFESYLVFGEWLDTSVSFNAGLNDGQYGNSFDVMTPTFFEDLVADVRALIKMQRSGGRYTRRDRNTHGESRLSSCFS